MPSWVFTMVVPLQVSSIMTGMSSVSGRSAAACDAMLETRPADWRLAVPNAEMQSPSASAQRTPLTFGWLINSSSCLFRAFSIEMSYRLDYCMSLWRERGTELQAHFTPPKTQNVFEKKLYRLLTCQHGVNVIQPYRFFTCHTYWTLDLNLLYNYNRLMINAMKKKTESYLNNLVW